MKFYTVKPEFFSLWGEDVDEDTIIDEAELARLAAEWEKPEAELLEQLEEATVFINGTETTLEAAAALMDDEIREALHAKGIEDPQEFVDCYCEKHLEKYGEDFTV